MQSSFYTNFSSTVTQQEALLNKLEQQISTGIAVNSPDQNPAAFETATIGNDQISALANNNTTQADISSQLGSVDNVYSSVSALFNNVQSVLEQALNGTTSPANMRALATQVDSAAKQLIGLGNTTGTGGTYLFGGSRGSVQPFQSVQTASGTQVQYMGDGGQSQAAISANTSASTIANGDVFMSGLRGDGFASVAANAANTGTGVLLSQGVANPAAANAFQSQSAPITLSFASGASGLTYTATQSGATVATGPAVTGTALQLGGVDFELSGNPAAGDSFTLSPSRPQSAFALLQGIATTLSSSASSPAQQAQTSQQLNQALASLSQYQQTVVTAQAQNGVTLQAVSNAGTADTNQSTALQTAVQNAIGINTATAITTLDQTTTALQAAMKAFGSVSGLSLFNYLP
ncbi:MAG: flagellar hook-associated protein 3 [Rhodospirillales bacterium 20-64-7]|nr:MAG: flagellar hook-associated protein 3 [Rhodospirillales bacterium 20-64-7]